MIKQEKLIQYLSEAQDVLLDASKILERTYEEIKDLNLDSYKSTKEIDWETLKDIKSLPLRER